MDISGSSSQVSTSGAGNGFDRPLPPIPEPELDLYSRGDESSHRASFECVQNSVNVNGVEGGENYENRGEQSSSEPLSRSEEVSSSERDFSEVKGGGSDPRHASELLVESSRQREFSTLLPRTGSDLNLPQNNNLPLPTISSPHTQNFPESPQVFSRNANMPPPGNNGNLPREIDRARSILILPGTVNYSAYRGQANPHYQVVGEAERVVLPRWQPDVEVSACTICGSTFNLFNRKHHCRKCGKVVCATCSPHRITIPREYIVRPPIGIGPSPPHSSRPSYDSMQSLSSEGGIEEGERVRLCNPCVPDPNTAPPQVAPPPYFPGRQVGRGPAVPPRWQYNPADLRPDEAFRFGTPPSSGAITASYENLNVTPRYPLRSAAPDTRPDRAYYGLSSLNAGTVPSSSATLSDAVRDVGRRVANAQNPRSSDMAGNSASHQTPTPRLDTGSSRHILHTMWNTPSQAPNMGSNMPYSDGFRLPADSRGVAPNRADQPRTLPGPVDQPTPRRIVPEEDICPVCQNEFPPAARVSAETKTQHVQDCIAGELARVEIHPSIKPAAEPPAGQRARSSTQNRGTGMTRYVATARDAENSTECVICFEPFLVGQDIALLTCFCKFHLRCIERWWARHKDDEPKLCVVHGHGFQG